MTASSADTPPSLSRERCWERLRDREQPWDVVVIGGGATGLGIAVDAASRGLAVALVERDDFGKGTSSRSTKLVHGGVRYLRQGNVTLVRDALKERSLLRSNAPHLVHDLPFVIPCRGRTERWYYTAGLKLYDLLAASDQFGRSQALDRASMRELAPALAPARYPGGGVVYHDGQFDDSRLLINLAQTAAAQGACLLNGVEAVGFGKNAGGRIDSVEVADRESGESLALPTRCVINAAGPFCDTVRRLDESDCGQLVAASQGVHLVVPRRLFPGPAALIVPKTADGRVMFVIPWHDRALIGTTDTAIDQVTSEPRPQSEEITFLLQTASEYLDRELAIGDVRAMFTGIRPLVRDDTSSRTASLSRDHRIVHSRSGLITITGGKWTTYRKMAEDVVGAAVEAAGLTAGPCRTETLAIHGASPTAGGAQGIGERETSWRSVYGSDLAGLQRLEAESPPLAEKLHPDLPCRRSEVIWAVRHEMARHVEDVLARRTRALFLDALAAVDSAAEVARLMAGELGRDEEWQQREVNAFRGTAEAYLPPNVENQA